MPKRCTQLRETDILVPYREGLVSKSEHTKSALADAFVELLGQMPYSEITVATIARTCNISRQTFYYHFHSLDDLVVWNLQREIRRTERLSASKGWNTRLFYALNSIYAHRDLVNLSLSNLSASSRAEVNALVKDTLGLVAIRFVDEAYDDAEMVPSDKALMARFYTAGFLEIVGAWIDDGMRESPEKLSKRLYRLLEMGFGRTIGESDASLIGE